MEIVEDGSYRYRYWVTGKEFSALNEGNAEKVLTREAGDGPLDGDLIDSAAGTAAVKAVLDTWLGDLQTQHGINGTTRILTFHPDPAELMNELGRGTMLQEINSGRYPEPGE